jgi:hypothetical protein
MAGKNHLLEKRRRSFGIPDVYEGLIGHFDTSTLPE